MTGFFSKGFSIVLVLGVLIFIHELGHFLVARFFKMGVRAFSLGFGPKVVGFRSGMTEYKLSAVPLGGYVQLVGQDGEDDSTEGFPPETWFVRRPAWQRMLVVAAGPLSNLVLAWALYAALFAHHGRFEVPAAVGDVAEDSAALEAGLKAGDTILAVDGTPIAYFSELKERVEESKGRSLVLAIKRGEETLTVPITPKVLTRKNIFGEDIQEPLLGVTSPKETIAIPLSPAEAVREGLVQTWKMTAMTGQVFWKLLQGVVPMSSMGGPLMIGELVAKQSEQGLGALAALTAMISVNLAILNLLPIPVLDGGHILFFALETVLRRPVPERWRMLTTKIGFAMLMALMVLATANDIMRYLPGMK